MAFKRSAVRSRLSPPKSSEILRFRNFFLFEKMIELAKVHILPGMDVGKRRTGLRLLRKASGGGYGPDPECCGG